MLSFVVFSAGIYLGLNFSIAVLLPFSAVAIGGLFLLTGSTLSIDDFKLLMFPLISIQAGYMVGLTARGFYGQFRTRFDIGQTKRI